jgi:hypothetical protein
MNALFQILSSPPLIYKLLHNGKPIRARFNPRRVMENEAKIISGGDPFLNAMNATLNTSPRKL